MRSAQRTAQNSAECQAMPGHARPCQAMPGHARPLNVDKNDRLSWLLPPEDKVEDKVEDITKSAQLIKRQLSSAQPDASAPQPPLVWLAPSHREHVGKTNSASKHVHNLHNTSKQNQQNTSASSLQLTFDTNIGFKRFSSRENSPLKSSLHDGEYRNRARKAVPKCSSWKILQKVALGHCLWLTMHPAAFYQFLGTGCLQGKFQGSSWKNPWKTKGKPTENQAKLTLQTSPDPNLEGYLGLKALAPFDPKQVAIRVHLCMAKKSTIRC